MRMRKYGLSLSLGVPLALQAALPRIPFSGAFGATEGAGAVVGWERFGLGVNPAAGDPRSMGLSLAGYSPFGLDGVAVTEAAASWQNSRVGSSVAYRGFFSPDGGTLSAWQVQESLRLGWGFAGGVSALVQTDEGGRGYGGGAGLLWNRYPFLTVGALSEILPASWGHELNAGLGADVGSRLWGSYAWRLCAENFRRSADPAEWRFGAMLRLHSMLSLQGGWSPTRQTMAFGIRFGMGNWEGFSALRRHSALGTTSVQGMHWRKPTGGAGPLIETLEKY